MTRTGTAFDRVYERHHRAVLAYCLRRTTRDLAYAAANEVFTVAWKRERDMPSGDRTLPWLYGVARKVLSHQHRGAQRFARLSRKAATVPGPQPLGPEAVVVQRADYEMVCRAVTRLGELDREFLLLSAWEGLSHAEIAASTGHSLAMVDKRLARAKQRLKRQFEAIHSAEAPRTPETAEGGEGA